MNHALKTLAASLVLVGAATCADAMDIAGLNVPSGPVFAVAQLYENAIQGVGNTLSGYGEVDSINGQAVNTLCANCELTYRFTDYVVSSIDATEFRVTGGIVNFYLGFGANNDFNPLTSAGSAADFAAATNGTLFLTLRGHAIDAAGNTFSTTGLNIGSATPSGGGSGLADVDMTGGGIANAFFNTNAVPALFGGGNADFVLTSSFNALFPPHPAECHRGEGPSCLSGFSDFRGNLTPVPEPETYPLMLAGLGALSVMARRRRRRQSCSPIE